MKPLHFSVDCEFTDNNVYQGALLSVGLVCENGQSSEHLFPVSTEAKVNDWTLKNNASLLMGGYLLEQRTSQLPRFRVGREWMNPQTVQTAAAIQQFVYTQKKNARPELGAGEWHHVPAVMVTWSGAYDWAYLCSLFGRCNLDNPFHYRTVDSATLAMALFPELGTNGWYISQDECCQALGIEPLGEDKKHIAVEDAKHQLEIYKHLLQARKTNETTS